MISNKVNSDKIDSYLFWLRFREILLVSPIVIILTVFLSFTMFERFNRIENNSNHSFAPIQTISLKE
ncbi:hypothetical protein PCC7424_4655 [Gloeothece citriformis PCC 7424]|uniref:Uncharacterized protein n=1 Tax=Gloeothece citriformis (strain PCC 7424) TaxID=65393 RepID=B7KBN9_GLOC7|nr:hypothetical protein [Gloeothece citriformis]ACK73017.1 hypothetical protein PCC7424_4655 [Gloeothece citriformis PCC 7424]